MNTALLLAARFESPVVLLTKVSEEFFGLTPAKACERAAAFTLPVPAVRLGSQKAPWLLSINDLAKYIDDQFAEARKAHAGSL